MIRVLGICGAVVWVSSLGATAHAAATAAPTPAPGRAATKVGSLQLSVLLVNDPDFPAVTPEAAQAILAEARATVVDKLSFEDLRFDIVGTTGVAEFLKKHVGPKDPCLEQFDLYRVRPDGRMPRDIPRDVVLRFLGRWQVDELRAFFPESLRAGLTGYDEIYAALMDEFARKLQLIAGFRLRGGESLLDAAKIDLRSYTRWICAVRNQPDADLILTNAFILYDLGSEPYPHSVFSKNKVGGASLYSPMRSAMGDRAVVSSTFSMVTDLPYFKEEGVDALGAAERLAVIGTFIVAHELGHALFKLPDFYDHPPQCLMTTKYETGYVSGYANIKRFPGACPLCSPYVEAKRHVFAATAARSAGDRTRSIDELKTAIRDTPKHIDGSYLRYVAGLSIQVAELYADAGDGAQARRWLRSALRILPEDPQALALEKRLGGGP